jgi:CMP-N-acetylneuraminic acid synthetase
MTLLPVPPEHNPHWVYFRAEDGSLRLSTGEETPIPRRQLLPPAFHREGSVYVVRRDVLMRDGSLYGTRCNGIVVDASESVNLDTWKDWEKAEELIVARQSGPSATNHGRTAIPNETRANAPLRSVQEICSSRP